MSNSNSTKTHCCTPCGYLCSSKSNLTKHQNSKKHKDKIENPDAVIVGRFKCPNCVKTYKGNTGLWAHKKVCKATAVPVAIPETPPPEIDLREEINNLKGMIIELAKNQQPTTINNNINNNNYINIFLNNKCHNACDIKKFIAGIDFSKENFHKILKDYVGGNAEIITKSYNSLPEYERPIYSFIGEDDHQKVVHIQHDDKWVVERELGWTNQVRIEYNDGVNDDPEPNSMYSLIRLFDKKKMEYFDENFKDNHLYLSQRKFNKDCFDDGKQLELIKKIIDTVSIEPEN
jgi:hypothetical protein